MPAKKLIGIIGVSLVGLATLGFATYRYIISDKVLPIVDYPGDFEGKFDDGDISLKRYEWGTDLNISSVSPGKTGNHINVYYRDEDNDGTVNYSNRKNQSPFIKVEKLKDQLEYNDYLIKIAQLKSKKSNEKADGGFPVPPLRF